MKFLKKKKSLLKKYQKKKKNQLKKPLKIILIKIIKKKKNRNRNKDENKGNKIRKDNIFKLLKAHSIKFVINTINHILDKENINIFCRLNWNFLVRL